MTLRKSINWPLLLLLFGISSVFPAYSAEGPAIKKDASPPIRIVKIKPSTGDIRRIERRHRSLGTTGNTTELHVVKLYVDMPAPGARAYALYIGDAKIQEYGGFAGGVFFKVYAREDLESWSGKPVRFLSGNQTFDLGVTFQYSAAQDPTLPGAALPDLRDALVK